MGRNWLLAHWRRILMQGVLCALLLATVGLAALVTHQKRLALRLPLGPMQRVGRLGVTPPRGWMANPAGTADRADGAGDAVVIEETVPEPLTGRRISVQRLRAGDLIAPLDFLLRTSFLAERDLTGREPGLPREVASSEQPARRERLDVAGWPGIMVSRTIGHLNGRRAQKQVLACSVIPPGQAVVIKLDGVGPVDAADEELVRQMAESTAVFAQANANVTLTPDPAGALTELGDGVLAAVPDHFWTLRDDDPYRTSRDLLGDGSDGHWTAAELIPCLWLADEPPEQQFLTMLAARDHTWHSTSVRRLGENQWRADRVTLAGEMRFPARAYCFTNGDDQALLVILHGGWQDPGGFDAAWAAISSNVRFSQRHDVRRLLDRGAEEAKHLADLGLGRLLPQKVSFRRWSLWDPAGNADKRDWMTLWIGTRDGSEWSGARVTIPTAWSPLTGGPMPRTLNQNWSGSADFASYEMHSDWALNGAGDSTQRTRIQQWELHDGVLKNDLAAPGDRPQPPPPQYVPGGWLPVALGHVGDQPMILRTDAVLGCDGAAPPGLWTLRVWRSTGDGLGRINVTINGTGRITRWWYDPTGTLQWIDFAADLRAQSVDATGTDRP